MPGAVQFLRHGVTDVMFTGDGAVLELRTWHAAHGRELLGPYSRFQWSHPGPAFFYLALPIYQLFHQRGPALNLFVLIANFAAATTLVLTARRLRGDLFALVVAVLLAVYETIAAPFPLSGEWNPMTPILPLALLVFLCVRLGSGAVGVLPAVAFVASAIVQTHVGFTPAALYLVATGALFCFRELFVVGPAAIDRRRLAIALGATAVVSQLAVGAAALRRSQPSGGEPSSVARLLLVAASERAQLAGRHRRRVGSAGDLPAGALPRARPGVDGRRHDRAPPAGRRAGGGGGRRAGGRLAAPRSTGRAPLGDGAGAVRRRHLRGARDPRRDLRSPHRLDLGAGLHRLGGPRRGAGPGRRRRSAPHRRRAGRRRCRCSRSPSTPGATSRWSATATFPWRRWTADVETFLRRARIDRLRLEIAAHDEWPRAAGLIVTLAKHGFRRDASPTTGCSCLAPARVDGNGGAAGAGRRRRDHRAAAAPPARLRADRDRRRDVPLPSPWA